MEPRIREFRLDRGLTQEGLAQLIEGVSARMISAWERGETNMTISDVYAVAKALDVGVEAILGLSPSAALSAEEKELLELFRACSPDGRRAILAAVRELAHVSREEVRRDPERGAA